MIDDFVVFTKTGLVLFRWETKLAKDPLDRFIKTVLLQEQLTDEPATVENYRIKCKIRNDLELIFVLIYQVNFSFGLLVRFFNIFRFCRENMSLFDFHFHFRRHREINH